MRYIQLTVNVPGEEIDSVCERLSVLGAEGFVIENEEDFKEFLDKNRQYWDYVDEGLAESYSGVSRVKCYFSDEPDGRATADRIKAAFPESEEAYTADLDWENSWKENYRPIEVGERLVIVPSWEDTPEDGRLPVILEPGLTFGTGSHPTTKMCLRALEKYAGKGKRILDLGCGSGILGIAALVLGCDSCTACDIDPKSPEMALENAGLNGIFEDRLKAYCGDITTDRSLMSNLGTGYDIVTANIVADVIISLAPHVRRYMAGDGVFICSGILDSRRDEVRAALRANGFTVTDALEEDEWRAFVCR